MTTPAIKPIVLGLLQQGHDDEAVWVQELSETERSAIGQTLDLIIPESSRPGHWAAFNKVMHNEQASTKEDVTYAHFLCQDGRHRRFNLRLIVLRDIHGNAIGAMNIVDPNEVRE